MENGSLLSFGARRRGKSEKGEKEGRSRKWTEVLQTPEMCYTHARVRYYVQAGVDLGKQDGRVVSIVCLMLW